MQQRNADFLINRRQFGTKLYWSLWLWLWKHSRLSCQLNSSMDSQLTTLSRYSCSGKSSLSSQFNRSRNTLSCPYREPCCKEQARNETEIQISLFDIHPPTPNIRDLPAQPLLCRAPRRPIHNPSCVSHPSSCCSSKLCNIHFRIRSQIHSYSI